MCWEARYLMAMLYVEHRTAPPGAAANNNKKNALRLTKGMLAIPSKPPPPAGLGERAAAAPRGWLIKRHRDRKQQQQQQPPSKKARREIAIPGGLACRFQCDRAFCWLIRRSSGRRQQKTVAFVSSPTPRSRLGGARRSADFKEQRLIDLPGLTLGGGGEQFVGHDHEGARIALSVVAKRGDHLGSHEVWRSGLL